VNTGVIMIKQIRGEQRVVLIKQIRGEYRGDSDKTNHPVFTPLICFIRITPVFTPLICFIRITPVFQ
jgi:hypothetical protein